MQTITVEVLIKRPVRDVWTNFTDPRAIEKWNHASDDWHCPKAKIDLEVGGRFSYIMSAIDETASFDFNGTFTSVGMYKNIQYEIQGGRKVNVNFEEISDGSTKVTEIFDAETENSPELQRQGWQAILVNFKSVCEIQV